MLSHPMCPELPGVLRKDAIYSSTWMERLQDDVLTAQEQRG